MDAHSYNVNITWKEGRLGEASSPELDTPLDVATPPEFEGGIPNIWSPEHLYTVAVSSCFMTTFLAIAQYSKFDYKKLSIEAEGVLEKVDKKFMMTKVILKPTLTITDENKTEKAERLLHKADSACLISNSIKSEIELKPKVLVE